MRLQSYLGTQQSDSSRLGPAVKERGFHGSTRAPKHSAVLTVTIHCALCSPYTLRGRGPQSAPAAAFSVPYRKNSTCNPWGQAPCAEKQLKPSWANTIKLRFRSRFLPRPHHFRLPKHKPKWPVCSEWAAGSSLLPRACPSTSSSQSHKQRTQQNWTCSTISFCKVQLSAQQTQIFSLDHVGAGICQAADSVLHVI